MALTRPAAGDKQNVPSLADILDEYADVIDATTGLPAGVTTTEDYTALGSSVLSAADATTGWTAANLTSGPTLDTGVKQEGSGSVKGVFAHGTVNGRLSWDNGSIITTPANRTHISLWVRWERVTGDGYHPGYDLGVKIRAAEGANLATPYVEINFPYIPEEAWYEVIIPIASLTGVRSVGIIQPTAPLTMASTMWLDHVRWKELTEAERALTSAATVGLVTSPSYTPGTTEGRVTPSDTKSVIELRPDRQYVTGLGGVRDIREYGPMPEDGSEDVSARLSAILNELPEGTTLCLSGNAQYRVDKQIRLQGKTRITLDGRGATLFTTVRRQSTGMTEDHFFQLHSCKDVTLRNLKMFGYRVITTNGNNLLDVIGTPTIDVTTKTLNALNEEIRLNGHGVGVGMPFYYARDKDLNWKFTFRLSQSSASATDAAEIRLVTNTGGWTAGREIAKQTLDLTTSATDYTLTHHPTAADMRERVYVMVRKKDADITNIVKIHSITDYGRVEFGPASPPAVESIPAMGEASGIREVGSSGTLIENCHIEGMETDAYHGHQTLGTVIRNCVFRANNRHGIAWDSGEDLLVEDVQCLQNLWDGIDLEPTATHYICRRPVMRNVLIDGTLFAAVAALNWGNIEDWVIENLTIKRAGNEAFVGGSRGGSFSNVTIGDSSWAWANGTLEDREADVRLYGIEMLFSNWVTQRAFRILDSNVIYKDGDPAGPDIDVDSGNNLAVGVKVKGADFGGSVLCQTTSRIVGLVSDFTGYMAQLSGTQLSVWGTGTPEGVLTASLGSVFHRSDGGAGTALYVKESGTGNTGWKAMTPAGHTHSHDADLTGVSADDHHAQSHTHASHTSIGANDHHNQAHGNADHDAALRTLYVRKTADESVNLLSTGSTSQNDNELFFSIAANEVWVVRFYLVINSGTVADWKYQLAVPSGATGHTALMLGASVVLPHNTDSANVSQFGADRGCQIYGIVVNSSTAGTVQFMWAQNTADAGDTTVKANSFLIANRIA
jgi:hypothetical protein